MNIIIGSSIILLAIGLFIYLARKPLDVKMRFRSANHLPRIPAKFQNDAPVAPDMLFEQPIISSTPALRHVPDFVPAPSAIEPDPIQHRVASILWGLNQVSCVYLDHQDMTIHKNGKKIGFIRCLDSRVHTGHIDEVKRLAREHRVKGVYLIVLNRIDKPAFKKAMQFKIKIITSAKLDILQAKASVPSFKG